MSYVADILAHGEDFTVVRGSLPLSIATINLLRTQFDPKRKPDHDPGPTFLRDPDLTLHAQCKPMANARNLDPAHDPSQHADVLRSTALDLF